MSVRKPRKRPSSQRQYFLYGLFFTLIIAGIWSSCHGQKQLPTAAQNAPQGNSPDAVELMQVVMPESVPSQILNYEGFSVSFNPDAHEPNWAAWELTRDEASGSVARSNKFRTDYEVPGCATTDDYRNSGFDRGHLCPAGDMKWNEQAMHDCFLLTNITPQANNLNSGAWKSLEEKTRVWARRDSALVIVCGPVLSDRLSQRIGTTGVLVPDRFFKVILAPFANPPRAIGFIMNNGRVEGGMQQAAVSVDEVERVTGFDFFSALPDSLENLVESQCNFAKWSRS